MIGPEPGTTEHLRLVTASKVSAIIGASPYISPWAMWQQMKGAVEPEPTSDVQRRGHLLEPAVLTWWEQQHPDSYIEGHQPWFPIEDWGGARPDLACADDGDGHRCLVEAKTAARDDGWGEPGTDEIPEHYMAQVQWQLGCAGLDLAYVPMLGARLEFREYVVRFDAELFSWLADEARAFWESLAADTPPPLDSSVATITCLRRMHPQIDADTTVLVTEEQVASLAAARAAKKAAEEAERAALAPILDAMGDAKYADTPTRSRAAVRQASGRGIALKLKGDAA